MNQFSQEKKENIQRLVATSSYSNAKKPFLEADLIKLISTYPSLKASHFGKKKLMEIDGTIPVLYSQATYNIPIRIRYPVEYPLVPPAFYVTPTPDMNIQVSQYVESDGTTKLNIFSYWNNTCNSLSVVEDARNCFAVFMPVFKRPPNSAPLTTSKTLNAGLSLITKASNSLSSFLNGTSAPNEKLTSSAPIQNPNPVPNQNSRSMPILNPIPVPVQNPPVYASNQNLSVPILPPNNRSQVPPNNNPMNSINNAPPVLPTQKSNKTFNQATINEILAFHSKTEKDLMEEIKILKIESENLNQNSKKIQNATEEISNEIEKLPIKVELLKASIENTQKWIDSSNNNNIITNDGEDLVEYKNIASKEFLLYESEEKSLELVIKAITDAMYKGIANPKDSIGMIRELNMQVFYAARLKEKARKIAVERA